MIIRLIARLLITLLFSGAPLVYAGGEGNGSSGAGNIFPISDGIAARVLDEKSLKLQNNQIVDSQTGEALIRIDHLPRRHLKKTYGNQLVPSRLGSVDGFEFVPKESERASRDNLWIVCSQGEHCLRLTPLSKTSPKVPSLIGALQK